MGWGSGVARLGCLALLTGASACFPYAVPPAHLSAGVGPTSGVIADSRGGVSSGAPHYTLRGGVHPLGAVEDLTGRSVDVGVGYLLEGSTGDGEVPLHGPYLALDAYLLPAQLPERSLRAGARVTGDFLFGAGELGGGGMLAGLVEWVFFGEGSYGSDRGDSFTAGVRSGELAVGAFLGVTHRVVGDQSFQGGVLGVSLRVPLLLGVVCCALPDDLGSSGSSSGSSSDESSGSSDAPSRTPARPSPGRTPARPTK